MINSVVDISVCLPEVLGHLNPALILNPLQEKGCAGVDTMAGSNCLGRHVQQRHPECSIPAEEGSHWSGHFCC